MRHTARCTRIVPVLGVSTSMILICTLDRVVFESVDFLDAFEFAQACGFYLAYTLSGEVHDLADFLCVGVIECER